MHSEVHSECHWSFIPLLIHHETTLIISFKDKHSALGEKSSALDDPTLFCDGCFALVSELEKDMSGSAASGKAKAGCSTEFDGTEMLTDSRIYIQRGCMILCLIL